VFIKAGAVVATAAAALLAVSPLAFASDHHGHHDGHGVADSAHIQGGLINIQDVGVQIPIQACNNSILEGVLGILSSGQRNSDSHDGKCGQRNSADDN
jgi:hypothetical protein